jgi:hypothetical protein
MGDSAPAAISSYVAAALNRLDVAYLHVAEPGPGHSQVTTAALELVR